MVVGGTFGVPGLPFVWNTTVPVPYRTDLGGLGMLDKSGADAFTADAFNVWQSVTTASIAFNKAADLAQDVTGANVMTLQNDPNSDINTSNAIIYDMDGSVTDALRGAGASRNVLGFAGPQAISTDGTRNFITRGRAVLNGRFSDGLPDPADVAPNKFKEVFVHELGHFSGLDHSQVNVEALTIPEETPDDLAVGLPVMFPFLLSADRARVDRGFAPLAVDDQAAIATLYPETANNPPTQVPFASSTGRIRGQIFFSDGVTPAQGFNVIARQVNNPATPEDESRRIAVSSVSGFLFTADAGNPVASGPGSPSPFGSRDQTLIGAYDIPGMPPGSYTVEVEAINSQFTSGSSVGPIGELGFQFPLPGPAEFWNWGESDTDVPTDSNPVTVTAGAVVTDINIILNDTPPRFDAWETARLLRWLRQLVARLDRRFAWTEM